MVSTVVNHGWCLYRNHFGDTKIRQRDHVLANFDALCRDRHDGLAHRHRHVSALTSKHIECLRARRLFHHIPHVHFRTDRKLVRRSRVSRLRCCIFCNLHSCDKCQIFINDRVVHRYGLLNFLKGSSTSERILVCDSTF